MPMDEPKTTGEAAFQPPPEAFLPPPAMPGKGIKRLAPPVPGEEPPPDEPVGRLRAGAMVPRGGNTNLIIGGAVLLMILLFIGWRMFRTENKVIGLDPTVPKRTFTVQPNQPLVRNVNISGSIAWSFEVTALDDTVSVGVVQRDSKDPQTLAALKNLPATYDPVMKGETHPMSGVFKTGQYSWVVLNEGKKAVRVKVDFKAQP